MALTTLAMAAGVRAEIFYVPELDGAPQVDLFPAPVYPWELKQTGTTGLAILGGVVDEKGKLVRVEVVAQSDPAFGKAALEAARKWRYDRGLKNGAAVSYYLQWPVSFKLPGADPYLEGFLFGFPKKSPADYAKEFQFTAPPEGLYNAPPVYPQDLWLAGTTGKAEVAYVVDATGRVVNTQITEASDPKFGQALAAAVERWKFKPATHKDKSTATIGRVTCKFDNYLPPDAPELRLKKLLNEGTKLTPANKLDAPLNPTHQEGPRYPLALREKPEAGQAVVEFIIDQDGWVRLPKIISATREEFGWAAAAAVRAWQFDPPRKDGKPVDTKIRVPLDFAIP